jgi:hypothetical protein
VERGLVDLFSCYRGVRGQVSALARSYFSAHWTEVAHCGVSIFA